MKKVQLNEVVVGLTFMIGVSLLGFYTIVSGDLLKHFTGTKVYVADFPDVYGLKRGDVVRVDGFEKGKVKSLKLRPDGEVRALLEVSPDVEIYRDDSVVKVTPFSPLGGRVVEISRGRAGACPSHIQLWRSRWRRAGLWRARGDACSRGRI